MPMCDWSSDVCSDLTLCKPMNRSTPGLPVHHQLPEFTQTHALRVSDAIQPSHPLSSPSPPAFIRTPVPRHWEKRILKIFSQGLFPWRWQPTRLTCPSDSPGKNTGVGCHFLLQRIFPTQGSNLGLPHCRQMLYHLSHQESPKDSRPDSALHRGNQALCGRSFTHRCVSVGIKKDPDRVRFISAILKSKVLSMWSCLPLCLWVSRLGPSSVETTPEKISSRSTFPSVWDPGFVGGEKSTPPHPTPGCSKHGPSRAHSHLVLAVLADHLQGALGDQRRLQHNLGEDPARVGGTGYSCRGEAPGLPPSADCSSELAGSLTERSLNPLRTELQSSGSNRVGFKCCLGRGW